MRIFHDKRTRKRCKIYAMLRAQEKRAHRSFHTPGHKKNGFDITELSYSDNLSCPRGCLAEAESDVAEILGANKSFLLTDGSTAGVYSILKAAKLQGASSIAVCEASHKSVFNACAILGIAPLVYPQQTRNGIPFAPTMYALNEEFPDLFAQADAIFLTSPDYYGNVADLNGISAYCRENNKLLLVDGAHGGHLHFDRALYAGEYADLWVDGVHKSLPALTQGAVVSARTETLADSLRQAVDFFRTTSPSYPIMASVEYAVKYPRNMRLENSVTEYARTNDRIYFGGDWTKLCVVFGETAFAAQAYCEKKGVYPEFCDGNVVMFYLSPATRQKDFRFLQRFLGKLLELFPLQQKPSELKRAIVTPKNKETEFCELHNSAGKVCAANCGLFPPCTPLLCVGERITEEKLRLLKTADNVYGLRDGKILIFKD